MKPLSAKQKSILEFMRQFLHNNGYPPSIRDICKACNISSTSVVDYNLNILARAGYIRRDPEVSRGIEIVDASRRARVVRVPVIGQIAAGEPVPVPTPDTWLAFDPSEMLELTEDITKGKDNLYALRVKGVSMIDAFINDGDIVLLQRTETAENGEMVAAWLKNEKETTLKRLYREGRTIRLQPANSQMQPIYADADNVEVQGRVVGVIRHVQ